MTKTNASGSLLAAMIVTACVVAAPPATGPVNEQVALDGYAKVIYVDGNREGDNEATGDRKAPYATIEAALKTSANVSSENRCAILVSQGTYQVDTIQMKSHVDLFGGFNRQDWSRDISGNRTELTPRADQRLVMGADASRLDGFVLKGAHSSQKGGAILCQGTSPTIANNVFAENGTVCAIEVIDADTLHQKGAGGGAICCVEASPLILQNYFHKNTTSFGDGGAIFCTSYSHPRIENNVFCDNESGVVDPDTRSSNGGAIACTHYSSPAISNNAFVGNHAGGRGDGGAIYGEYFSEPEIVENVFVHNSAEDDGAAAYFMAAARPKIRRNTLVGNGPGGGVIRLSKNGSALLEANRIVGNPAGGVKCRSGFLVSMNNVICENSDRGLSAEQSVISSRNDTICNHPEQGVATRGGSTRLVNALVAGNRGMQVNLNTEDIWVRHCLLSRLDSHNEEAPRFGTTSSSPMDRINIIEETPVFESDETEFAARVVDVQPAATKLDIDNKLDDPASLVGRPLRVGERWSIVKSAEPNSLTIWGALEGDDARTGRNLQCFAPRTYHVRADSPSVDRGDSLGSPGTDIDGEPRSQYPQESPAVDIGADEFVAGRGEL